MHDSSSPSPNPLAEVIQTVHRLRAPGGCPWDREQTHQSLRQYLVEEAYETLDVLDEIDTVEKLQDQRIRASFREELGDVLLQVLLHSEMANEQGAFSIGDVAAALNEKLIRRHPHVFGELKVDDSASVIANWEKIKAREKAERAQAGSVLDSMPKGLPALQRTARVIEKVTKVGFQWPDLHGPLEKLEEELQELKAEVLELEKSEKAGKVAANDSRRDRIAAEMGDLLFSMANVAYLMKVSPEDALRGTLQRFETRFRHVERRLRENGKSPEQSTLEEMDRFWDEAKKLEKQKG